MEFALDSQTQIVEDRARRFAREVLAPRANELDRTGAGVDEQLRAVHAAGLFELLIDRDEGGLGVEPLLFVRAIRALASGCPSTALCLCLHAVSAATLLVAARPDQRRKVIDGIRHDGAVCAVAVSEPRTGANPNAPETLAVRSGDGYLLSGVKSFVTNARWASFVLVAAVHEDLPGVSHFLVEPFSTPGFEVCRDWSGFGMRATGSDRVVLDRCRVAGDAVLGEPGKSAQVTRSRGPVTPLGQAAVSLGAAENAVSRLAELDLLAPETPARREVRARLAAASALLDRAAIHAARPSPATQRAVPEAKLVCDTAAIRIADLADEIARSAGIFGDPTLDRCRRDVRAGAVMTLNAEVCRDNIARSLLGMGK